MELLMQLKMQLIRFLILNPSSSDGTVNAAQNSIGSNSFGETVNVTRNVIDVISDLHANSFDGTVNASQNAIDMHSDLQTNSLVEFLMQFKLQLICLLI
jgi:hypothetical protein